MKILKKKRNVVLLCIIGIIMIFELCCIVSIFTKGKLKIYSQASSVYYKGSNIDVLVDVTETDGDLVASKIKMQLYDKDGKKVKNAKVTEKVDKGKSGALSLKMPDNIETGKYNLKISVNSGIYSEKTELPINIIKDNLSNINISLDKGIYKPGDELNYRALVVTNKEYKPNKQEVTVEIYDGNKNKVYSQNAETSEYGIVSGKFQLADEVNSGTYKLTVKTDAQEVSKEFTVNPYITPQFETTITTDKESYILGENAQVTISSKYFFGEPVVNANVKGKIGDKEIVGITDANGNYSTTYKIEKEGNLNLEFEVIDTSNYAVEVSKTVSTGTDIFEIELLPEYGKLASGLQNDVYVITKTSSGEPVKTYSNIKIGNVSKQVISDENGIGVFTLTPEEISRNSLVKISSEDMNSNKVNKEIPLDISYEGIYVKTDKVKYSEGDDIKVSLESTTDQNSYTIYVFKNKELLKIYTSDQNDFEFNLDNVTGVIDIYTKQEGSYKGYQKRTIFIKPNKALNINIETDKTEYKPGENLNIKFDTKNQDGQEVDAALLVSILDEAILDLADNDLSIDNIKLALQDIELTQNVTAADLYAEILDETSDLKLNSVLLKQNSNDININYNVYQNNNEKYKDYAILVAIVVFIVVCIYCIVHSDKTRSFFISIVNVLFIFALLMIWFSDILYRYNPSMDMVLILNLIISIILYALILIKQKKYIFNMAKEIFILPFLLFVLIRFVLEILPYSLEEQLTFLLPILFILILVILNVTLNKKRKNEKLSKIENIIKLTSESLLKGIIFWIAYIILVDRLEGKLALFIILLFYIILTKVVIKKPKLNIQDGKLVLNVSNMDMIGIICGIILILLIIVVVSLIGKPAKNIGGIYVDDRYDGYTWSGNTNGDSTFSMDSIQTPSTSSESSSSSFDFNNDLSFTDTTTSKEESGLEFSDIQESQINNTFEEIEKDIKTEENVRNIFLESLAFIPEVVTQNGKAETVVTISDNITTWNIQTIGNTKDGEIGSASSSFKVFKEFFVDFSLPQNSVVSDKVEIPVTLYNYTENNMSINLDVKTNEWSNIGEYTKVVDVPAKSTSMVYVPLELIKNGNNTLRIESKSGNLTDIVEKSFNVDINGLKKEEIALSGSITENYSQDMIFNENAIEGSRKIKVKLYPAPILQVIDGIEGMLKLPSGCFEQTSASLYPDVLVLKYLEQNNINNQELRDKALNYIEKGYQKLLTYEVKGEDGGYSLYGHSPAEPVITAFGLMEMKEISDVYNIDEDIIPDMQDYLFSKQKSNGSFDDIHSTYIGGAEKTDDLAMNAYITWALSEVCPEDKRLEKSVEYLEKQLEDADDNYTLALIANVFANTNNEKVKDIIKQLNKNINIDNDKAYLSSKIRDYYGSRARYQTIQTTALYSMALSKTKQNENTNSQLVNYLLNSKRPSGTWGTTQSTILALQAINRHNSDNDITKQKITVKLNDEEKTIDVDENILDVYELEFNNVTSENKIEIGLEKGKITYEVIKEYYVPYTENLNKEYPKILVEQTITQTAKVNDNINQELTIRNNSGEYIENALVQINIPQGCSVNEESLSMLVHNKLIDKYEYNYGKINLYLRKFSNKKEIKLNINYKALYPETVTAGAVIAYDYYNPELQGILAPVQITVAK